VINLNELETQNQKPPRILIHGGEGVGKTTFACSAPNPIVIDVEDGLGTISVPHIIPKHLTEVFEVFSALIEQEHSYRTLVIDSLDALEELITDYLLEERGWKSIGEPAYGRGYVERSTVWRQVFSALEKVRDECNMGIILVAHSRIEKVEDPVYPAYDRHVPDLYKTEAAKVVEWCDIVGYAMIKTLTIRDGERVRATTGGERILYTESNPAYVAKTRYPIKDGIPLDWAEFEKELKGGNHGSN